MNLEKSRRSIQFLMAMGITAVFFVLTLYAVRELMIGEAPGKELPFSFIYMVVLPLAMLGIEERTAFATTMLALSAFSLIAGVTACWVFAKANDSAAARQIGWLLLLVATLVAWAMVMPALPDLWTALKLGGPVIPVALTTLLILIATGFARFFVIFPRAVDTDSVQAAFFNWRWARWLVRDHGKRSLFLRPWHASLVSGRAMWLLPLATLLIGAAIALLGLVVSYDVISPLLLVFMLVGLFFYLFVALPYATASMFHVYHFGSEDERRRAANLRSAMISVFLLAVIVFMVGNVLPFTKGHLPELAQGILGLFVFFGLAFLPVIAIVAVTVSVLQGGALDPRVAFRRFTVWTILGLIVTLGFVMVERFAALKVVQWFQLAPDTGAIVAGAVIAMTFVPLRNVVQRAVERLAERWIPVHLTADGHRAVETVAIIDLSGYTALSARDESAALLQSAVLKRVATKAVDQYDGRLVKSLGDAVMLVFESTANALAAVQAIHAEFPATARAVTDVPLPLHSAIHQGEVVTMNDGDIFGQTVNVTARLVDAALAGQIVVSGDAAKMLPDARLEPAGERRFKNVPKPVHCLLVQQAQ